MVNILRNYLLLLLGASLFCVFTTAHAALPAPKAGLLEGRSTKQCYLTSAMIKALVPAGKSIPKLDTTPPNQTLDIRMGKDGVPAPVQLTEDSPIWSSDWSGETPSNELVRGWLSLPKEGAAHCVDGQHHVQSEATAKEVSDDDQVSLSVGPVAVNQAGNTALLSFTERHGQLGGATKLVVLKKLGAEWALAGERITSVS
jgi:hypothetical protein